MGQHVIGLMERTVGRTQGQPAVQISRDAQAPNQAGGEGCTRLGVAGEVCVAFDPEELRANLITTREFEAEVD